MNQSKEIIKFEKHFTASVKDIYQVLRSNGINTASYAKVQEMVWDLVFNNANDWSVTSTIKAFKKLSEEEQVMLKLTRPEIVVAKTWSGKK